MHQPSTWPQTLAHAIGRWLFWLVAGSYVVAAFAPGPGLWLRGVSVGRLDVLGERVNLSLPALLLALLLFNAGFGVAPGHLRQVLRRPGLLLAGLAANLAVPLVFLVAVAWALTHFWHNFGEAQSVVVGLTLVVAMPIAGSSTAWSQNADGNLALSLGLVLGSTLLSPLTTPAVFRSASLLSAGEYADRLGELAGQGTGLFLVLYVLLPSLAGLGCRRLVGDARATALLAWVKLVNAADLLVLCYANAAVSLPEAVGNPDPDFVVVMLVVVTLLCGTGFGVGWLLARLLGAAPDQRNALMFGLGMNNNGTGLVLASLALAAYPRVMQPLILANLVQHLVAAAVSPALVRSPTAEPAPAPVSG